MPVPVLISRGWPLLALAGLVSLAPDAHAQRVSARDKVKVDALQQRMTAAEKRYGDALLEFEGKPTFRGKSESALPGNRGVVVATELLRAGNDPTPVDYLMRNIDGVWKIFDVRIEGISYVQTFKTQFDAPLRQKGIAEVAKELRNGTLQAGQQGGAKSSGK